MKYLTASAAVLGLALTALPVQAQNVNANNLVSVDVTNVEIARNIAQNLARDLEVDVDVEDIAAQIQALNTVQVPVGIAANVCDVSANVLARQADDAEACEAENTSQAFNQAVSRQLNLQ